MKVSIFKLFAGSTITALLFTLGVLPAAAQVVEEQNARIPAMTAMTANDSQCLTRTFPGEDRVAEMPNTALEFTQGGQTDASVLVTFVASWPLPRAAFGTLPPGSQPAGALIFLNIDNQRVELVSEQGGVLVHEGTATSVSNGTHGFTFVTRPIAPGNHIVEMLWANNLLTGTGTICVNERSLVVQHRR